MALEEVVPTVRRRNRDQPGGFVLGDLAGQGVGAHGEVLVDRHRPQVLGAEAGDLGGFFDRRVCLGGAVGNQAAVAAFCVA